MSAAAATKARRALSSMRGWRSPPRIRQPLRKDEERLPIPHVDLVVGQTHPSRVGDHYHNTLADDLLYMTYTHELGERKSPRQIRLRFDPDDPYVVNRKNPPVGGAHRQLAQLPPVMTPDNVVRLERIVLHSMQKEAVNSRSALLGVIAAFRAISGKNDAGGGRGKGTGVQIVHAKKNVGGWARAGIPTGVVVDLEGPPMYDFISTLVEFVLPRMREFNGITLPVPSASTQSPSAIAGVVSFGLPPEAMGLFPQIEVNMDMYPKMYGMHVQFITNAVGLGAQKRAQALLSGFQIPFARK